MGSITMSIAGMLTDPVRSCVPIDDDARECYRGSPTAYAKSVASNSVPTDGFDSLINFGRSLQELASGLADLVAGKAKQ